MKTSLVQTFLTVAACRSISEAANQLYVVQSTVSMRLQQLEDELGVKLIERGQGVRSIYLTPRGEAFIPIAERWLQLNGETEQFALGKERYPLSIAAPDSLNLYYLTPLYKKMMAENPAIKLRIVTSPSSGIFGLVDNKEVDIGFVFIFYKSTYSSIVSRPVLWEDLYLVCSAAGEWPDEPVHPKELDPRHEIVFKMTTEIQRWHDYWWDPAVSPYAYVETAALIMAFIDDPRCWALCPRSVAESFRRSNKVRILKLAGDPPKRICHILTRRADEREQSPGVQYFLQTFNDYLISPEVMDYGNTGR